MLEAQSFMVAIAEDLSQSPVVYVREDQTLDHAMQQFGKRTHEELPVLPAGDAMVPIGTISRDDVIRAYNREILKVDLAGTLSSRIASAARMRTWETVGGYVLALLEVPVHLSGRRLDSLALRERYGVQIILIERIEAPGANRFALPTRETVLQPGESIIVFGQRESVDRLARKTR